MKSWRGEIELNW